MYRCTPIALFADSVQHVRRVGFATQVSAPLLPASVNEISRSWEIVEKTNIGPPWDFLWNTQVEEGRERDLLRRSFTISGFDMPSAKDNLSEKVLLAESVVKVSALYSNQGTLHLFIL